MRIVCTAEKWIPTIVSKQIADGVEVRQMLVYVFRQILQKPGLWTEIVVATGMHKIACTEDDVILTIATKQEIVDGAERAVLPEFVLQKIPEEIFSGMSAIKVGTTTTAFIVVELTQRSVLNFPGVNFVPIHNFVSPLVLLIVVLQITSNVRVQEVADGAQTTTMVWKHLHLIMEIVLWEEQEVRPALTVTWRIIVHHLAHTGAWCGMPLIVVRWQMLFRARCDNRVVGVRFQVQNFVSQIFLQTMKLLITARTTRKSSCLCW